VAWTATALVSVQFDETALALRASTEHRDDLVKTRTVAGYAWACGGVATGGRAARPRPRRGAGRSTCAPWPGNSKLFELLARGRRLGDTPVALDHESAGIDGGTHVTVRREDFPGSEWMRQTPPDPSGPRPWRTTSDSRCSPTPSSTRP
jgi:hypothetical protein